MFTRLLDAGDPIPWFRAPVLGGEPSFAFDRMGARHSLLLFFGSAALPAAAEALKRLAAYVANRGDGRAGCFGVSIDPADVATGRIGAGANGVHFLLDHDRRVSILYGAAAAEGTAYRPHWLLVGPTLQALGRFALADGAGALDALERALATPVVEGAAPILQVEQVLEPALCRELVDLYERHGGIDSGVMRQLGGKTVAVMDHGHKRRRDHEILEEPLREAIRRRVVLRLVPMIQRAFQFQATRIERYIVACYDGAEDGHFNPHRDNTTLGTAHRRFAVTINLNDGYDGGDLRFPEFGARAYRAGIGGAVVFSCSMMHEATRVTAGKRYATLPFLYDDAAAAVRQANLGALRGVAPPSG